MNTLGHYFRLTTFGESHGAAVGGVRVKVDVDYIQHELNRRRPGQSRITTPRSEGDRVELLSGVFEGRTTGCPIGFVVRNEQQHSADYDNLRELFRPSHADFTYQMKYGVRDHRGGGRSSARETISRVVGGAFAKLLLADLGVDIKAWTRQVGRVVLDRDYHQLPLDTIETNAVRCPDAAVAAEMERLILEVRADGDTVGGVIECVVRDCPPGWGAPVFDKLHAQLVPVVHCADRNSTMSLNPISPRRQTTVGESRGAFPTDRILCFVWLSNRWRRCCVTNRR